MCILNFFGGLALEFPTKEVICDLYFRYVQSRWLHVFVMSLPRATNNEVK